MLNTGTVNTTIEKINKIVLQRPPTAGDKWKGVPHSSVIAELRKQTKERGIGLSNFRGVLSCQDADLSASFTTSADAVYHDVVPTIGFAASTWQQRVLTFYAGGISTDDTTIVIGFRPMGRYSLGFDLKGEITTALDWWENRIEKLPKIINRLWSFKMTHNDATDLLLTAMRSEDKTIMPGSRFRKIDKMWKALPRSEGTAWNLMQLYYRSQSLQNSPTNQMGCNFKFTQILLAKVAQEKVKK